MFTRNSSKNIQLRIFALLENYKVTHSLKGFPRYRWIRNSTSVPNWSAHKKAANRNVSAQCIILTLIL